MRRHPLYLAFGVLVILGFAGAEMRGWRLAPASESRAGPRSLRDNPGSSRAVYRAGSSRYPRGK